MVSKKTLSEGSFRAPLFYSSDERGFSLVELMVVVAIIGLLSAVAIPNFQKFQARSRTTEAKLQLAAIYTAESSFFGTYTMYHSCLNYMGYDPVEYKSTRFYTVGFNTTASIDSSAYNAAIAGDISTADCPNNFAPVDGSTFFNAGTGAGGSISDSTHLPSNSVGSQAAAAQFIFTAGAAGVIHKGFPSATNSSAFTIQQDKKISTIRTGY